MSSWRNTTRGPNRTQGQGSRGRASGLSRGQRQQDNTGNRRLENIASVSRSSGLGKDGDTLKDYKTQEEYRDFIQTKLDSFRECTTSTAQQTREIQENLLILFRKLREGIVASKRNDAFSVEVCETSLFLATLFDSPRQLQSILPYFLPHPSEGAAEMPPQQNHALCAIFITLIHQLVLGYPSQNLYRQSAHSISGSLLQRSSKAYIWVASLSSSLWTNNYPKFEKLTRRSSVILLFDELSPDSLSAKFTGLSLSAYPTKPNHDLARKALCHVVDTLRIRVRDSTWNVIRSSYRELSCNADSETRNWLARALVIRSEDEHSLDTWLEEKRAAGHIRLKEGVDGRWIICR